MSDKSQARARPPATAAVTGAPRWSETPAAETRADEPSPTMMPLPPPRPTNPPPAPAGDMTITLRVPTDRARWAPVQARKEGADRTEDTVN